MANSLLSEQPPAPDSGPENALQSASPPPAPAGGAPQGQAQQPAPPTHEQVVAGLRHFDAVKRELKVILSDPALGKSNMKSKIIDGVTRLVADGMMQPAEAVTELAKVPSEPLAQMKWAKTMFAQAQTAENGILDHYGAGNPHMGTVAEHAAMPVKMDRGDHLDHMGALMANYGPKKNG